MGGSRGRSPSVSAAISAVEWIDATDYGASGDGVTDARDALSTAAGLASGKVLYLPQGTYRVASDLTIAADVTLRMDPGAEFSVDALQTLTINAEIEDTRRQMFTGAGAIAGTPILDFVRPEWWGAVRDGATDDRGAMNTTLTFAAAAVKVVRLIAGSYRLGSDITFPAGVTLEFDPGAMLDIDQGVRPLILGTIKDTLSQIFTGDGDLAYGAIGTDNSGLNGKALRVIDTTKNFTELGFRAGDFVGNTRDRRRCTVNSVETTVNPNDTLRLDTYSPGDIATGIADAGDATSMTDGSANFIGDGVTAWTSITTGVATSGSATTVVNTAVDFTVLGVGRWNFVKNLTDGSEGMVLANITTTNPNDTLYCLAGFTGGVTNQFQAGDSYDVIQPGRMLVNLTDGSEGRITSVAGQDLICADGFSGGSNNFFQAGDEYSVRYDAFYQGDTYVVYSNWSDGKLKNDHIRPEWWGALADGVEVCTEAFNSAIIYASHRCSKVAKIKLLPGTYVLDDSMGGTWDSLYYDKDLYDFDLNVGNNYGAKYCFFYNWLYHVVFEGADAPQRGSYTEFGSVIAFKDVPIDTYGFCLYICPGWTFRDLRITSIGTAPAGGFWMWNHSDWHFFKVDMRGFTHECMFMANIWRSNFYHSKFSVSDIGILHYAGALNNFYGCSFTTRRGWPIGVGFAGTGNNITFTGCDFEGENAGIIVNVPSVQRHDVFYSRGWILDNCYFEAMAPPDGIIINLNALFESRVGPNYMSDPTWILSMHTANSVVDSWRGVVHIYGESTVLLACPNVVDFGSNINLLGATFLQSDGSQPLLADWDAGPYDITLAELNADVVNTSLASVVDLLSPNLGTTVVVNGGFAVDTAGWSADDATLTSELGGQVGNCLKIENTTGQAGIAWQEITCVPGAWYKVTWYYKTGNRINNRLLIGTAWNVSDVYLQNAVDSGVWEEHTGTFRAPQANLFLWMFINSGQVGYYGFFDEISIQPIESGQLVVGGQIYAYGLKTGATQGAAGAVAGEFWRDTADNTVKVGI